MRTKDIDDHIACKANCDWIVEQAKMLKALFYMDSDRIIVLNRTRAMSAIDTMQDSLNELLHHIEEMEEL